MWRAELHVIALQEIDRDDIMSAIGNQRESLGAFPEPEAERPGW